jgi:adenine-specific DNA-methyltransferase
MQIVPSSGEQPIFMDFFAGSGTLGQAVLESNAEGGNSRFILVQLPESTRTLNKDGTYSESEASKAGYATIADVMRERVRRAMKKLTDSENGKLDLSPSTAAGFRSFKLAESNFKTWDAGATDNAEKLETQLELHVDHLREGRSAQDFLYEILLKSGFPLTANVDQVKLGGQARRTPPRTIARICPCRARRRHHGRDSSQRGR